jgi:hypothetical protein
MPRASWLAAMALAALGSGCGGETDVLPPVPITTPSPAAVAIGAHTGRTEITVLEAQPAPGATLSGCGRDGTGCGGRIRMRFRLRNATGGPVLDAVAFLHATTLVACWRGSTGPFRLEAGAATELSIVFDQPDTAACGAPADIATMKLVVVGPVEVDSLQEWAIRYTLLP